MKNETARREIESLDYYLQNHTNDYSEESHTAMMMAVKVLDQEPCADAVSRQVAIDTIESWLSCDDYNKAERHIMRATQSMLYDLPLVNPQVKVGHWVENDRGIPICSCCGKYKYEGIDGSIYDDVWFPNYCPNCGARMVEPQESERV